MLSLALVHPPCRGQRLDGLAWRLQKSGSIRKQNSDEPGKNIAASITEADNIGGNLAIGSQIQADSNELTLQRPAVPHGQIRRRLIRALQKLPQRPIRITLRAQIVILQNELAQRRIVARRSRTNLCFSQSRRRRGCVAIERRLAKAAIPRPETRADHLVRVRLTHDRIELRPLRRTPP